LVVRRWRLATAFAVLFMAGALGSEVYLRPGAFDRTPEVAGQPPPPIPIQRDNPALPAAVIERSFGAPHDLAARLAACPPGDRAKDVPADVRPVTPPNVEAAPAAAQVEADCPLEQPPNLVNQNPQPAAELADKADEAKARAAARRAEAARRAARIEAINRLGAAKGELGASPPAAAKPMTGRAGAPAASVTAPMAEPTK
jgi:hypothetical protein